MKQENNFYVVGVGASAGGLDAVQHFFDNIPRSNNVAYIIIQHLSPDFKSLMPELLAKHTGLNIYTAEDGQEIKPNCIYLNQRNKNIGIENNKFTLLDKAPKNHLNLPIDILFHMLGESYKEKAIGVILSGTGSDGSRGIKTIKEAGGTILVQEPGSAQFDGMPNSAILTNLADFILPPHELAQKVVQFTQSNKIGSIQEDIYEKNETVFQEILSVIYKHTGVNFKKYKVNTLLRRLERRMNLHNLSSFEEYLKFLRANTEEITAINQEFLIGVTCFFRDREAFEILEKSVIPAICNRTNHQNNIRIWIPACSSGEEVYSIAILIEDYIRTNKLTIDYKIFATDIDRKALRRASLGSYSVNNSTEIKKEYLQDYFVKTGEKIQIIKRIREKIVFSYHDVIKDPPFIKVDLISCRNLLIYFSTTTQKTVLSSFQFALNKDAFLFLGSSESLGTLSNLFAVHDQKNKIFQSMFENKRLTREDNGDENLYNISAGTAQFLVSQNNQIVTSKKQNELFYYKYLSKKHSPVTVFVDKEFNVQFILGEFKKWFRQTDGLFSNNLLQMVEPELATIIRNGIRRVIETNNSLSIKNLVYDIKEDKITTDLYFESVNSTDTTDNVYMVQFDMGANNQSEEKIVLSNEDVSNFSKQRIEDLELDLKENRAQLQNVVEELETSNEELQSSNEELMSSNEELQSSNEELQSVNEELYTVNSEFQEKNKELENLNNDINNLLNSTDIGTLFLDNQLNIRKFTPAVKRLFHLEESDIGRSVMSFASEFDTDIQKSILSNAKGALENLTNVEKEVRDLKGNWYLKRITPFITSDKKIDGVVITFVDINNLKKVKSELHAIEARLETALVAGNMAWWELKSTPNGLFFSKSWVEMLGLNPSDVKNHDDLLALIHPDDYAKTLKAFQQHLSGQTASFDCQYRIKNHNGDYQWFQDIGKIVLKNNQETIMSGIVVDINIKKQIELELFSALQNAETANIYKNQFLANMSHEIRTPINGLVGFASLLGNEDLDHETKSQYVSIVESCSNQLLNLINDIIDVAKIEAGELKIELENCDINKIFNELEITFNNIQHQKEKNDIQLVKKVFNPNQELIITTDGARLKQVLTNLIGNALKFTNEGSIEFGYQINDHSIVFTVADTGIGMSQNKLDLIFERFQQIEHDSKIKYDGTGLGLTISKGIVHLLGGQIVVTSQFGKGSTFAFEIPYRPIKNNSYTKNTNLDSIIPVFEGKKILVVEDEINNQLYLKAILQEFPLQVLWAKNGLEAVTIFKKESNIAIVLMDIRMPLLDGYQATRMLLDIKPEAKVIAQTANAMSGDKDKCLEIGFVDYIPKPITKDKLIETLGKWMS